MRPSAAGDLCRCKGSKTRGREALMRGQSHGVRQGGLDSHGGCDGAAVEMGPTWHRPGVWGEEGGRGGRRRV